MVLGINLALKLVQSIVRREWIDVNLYNSQKEIGLKASARSIVFLIRPWSKK